MNLHSTMAKLKANMPCYSSVCYSGSAVHVHSYMGSAQWYSFCISHTQTTYEMQIGIPLVLCKCLYTSSCMPFPTTICQTILSALFSCLMLRSCLAIVNELKLDLHSISSNRHCIVFHNGHFLQFTLPQSLWFDSWMY